MWRAIRHGLDGRMIDFERGDEYESSEIVERLLAWTAPARAQPRARRRGRARPAPNGSQRQRAMIESGATMRETYESVRARDARDLFRGGAGMSEDAGAAERGGAARGLRGAVAPADADGRDPPGGGLADQPRRPAARASIPASAGERDLGQARDGIDGARALMPRARAPRGRRGAAPAARGALRAAAALRAARGRGRRQGAGGPADAAPRRSRRRGAGAALRAGSRAAQRAPVGPRRVGPRAAPPPQTTINLRDCAGRTSRLPGLSCVWRAHGRADVTL